MQVQQTRRNCKSVQSHPSHKNKNVARVGHPKSHPLWVSKACGRLTPLCEQRGGSFSLPACRCVFSESTPGETRDGQASDDGQQGQTVVLHDIDCAWAQLEHQQESTSQRTILPQKTDSMKGRTRISKTPAAKTQAFQAWAEAAWKESSWPGIPALEAGAYSLVVLRLTRLSRKSSPPPAQP